MQASTSGSGAQSSDLFIVLEPFRTGFSDFVLALQPLLAPTGDAPVLGSSDVYYRADTDIALLTIRFDRDAITPQKLAWLTSVAARADLPVLDPSRLGFSDRRAFYEDYLPNYRVRVEARGGPQEALEELARLLALPDAPAMRPASTPSARVATGTVEGAPLRGVSPAGRPQREESGRYGAARAVGRGPGARSAGRSSSGAPVASDKVAAAPVATPTPPGTPEQESSETNKTRPRGLEYAVRGARARRRQGPALTGPQAPRVVTPEPTKPAAEPAQRVRARSVGVAPPVRETRRPDAIADDRADPDTPPEAGPDLRRDSRPDLHRDSRPDLHRDSRPDLRRDSRPDVQHDSRPDLRRDSRPDAQHDSRPDLHRDSRPDLHRDSRPDLHRDSRPDLHRDSRPDLHRDSRPDLRAEARARTAPPVAAEPSAPHSPPARSARSPSTGEPISEPSRDALRETPREPARIAPPGRTRSIPRAVTAPTTGSSGASGSSPSGAFSAASGTVPPDAGSHPPPLQDDAVGRKRPAMIVPDDEAPPPLKVRFLRGDMWFPGRLRALSLQGARLAAAAPPRPGDIVQLAIGLDHLDVMVNAEVTQVTTAAEAALTGEPSGFSVHFSELESQARTRLVTLLKRAKQGGISLKPPPPRASVRFPVRWPANVITSWGELNTAALDVSRSGLFLAATGTAIGARELVFHLPMDTTGRALAGRAQIAREVSEDMASRRGLARGYGVRILDFSRNDAQRYDSFLERIRLRTEKRVLVAARRERGTELGRGLIAAGYAVHSSNDLNALTDSVDASPPDAALIDAGLLASDPNAGTLKRALQQRQVPVLTIGSEQAERARAVLDQLLQIT